MSRYPGCGRALACRVRRHPRSDPRARRGRDRRRRPGCGRQRGAVDGRAVARAHLARGGEGAPAAAAAQARASRARLEQARQAKAAIARLKARETDRRKDWIEKTSTGLARHFDVIAVEDLNVRGMTRSAKGTIETPGRNIRQKAGLNRGILAAGWGRLVERLEHKAPGRVVKIHPAYTSQRCSACGIVDGEARESQAAFRCRSCGYACNADVNAARNIRHAAGHAVSARGGSGLPVPVNREPQRDLLLVG
ncbi:transposase [Nonomuraea sp. NPDC049152]|uniref:RNA-guided endonuclease InsQ/TnpB family protein n=1 Tax=Nonomuraea sp. NPDC049152 TaxID=3154350 RepID=UPI0033E26565